MKGRAAGTCAWLRSRTEYKVDRTHEASTTGRPRTAPSSTCRSGAGSRRCLDAAFAMYEMKLVLATVLRHHHLRPERDAPARAALRNTTLGPAAKIQMIGA